VVEPQPAEAEHSAAGRSDGIAEALHLYQSQAERVPVLELQLREAQARASRLEALLARLRAERTAASAEQPAKVKKATKKEIHELEERLYKAYEDRLMDMNTHLKSYQMCYELFRDQCHKLEETLRKEEYKARITLVQPVGKAGPAGPNYLRGRGAGLYHFRPPWGDPAFDDGYRYGVGSSLVTTVEAYKAEDAAKTFVRQFAYDGDPEDAYADPKPYTRRLKIEPITSALDHEPIFQGYRRAPPPPDLPPELSWWGAAAERFEEEATRLEWRKLWQPVPDWGSFESYWELPIVEKNNPEIAQQLKEAWRGEGPPVCWRIFHRRVPPADRQRWAEPLHDAEIAAWRKENEWQGGEWAPVGPRFHVDGPFPKG
jgi:hypothetical protein